MQSTDLFHFKKKLLNATLNHTLQLLLYVFRTWNELFFFVCISTKVYIQLLIWVRKNTRTHEIESTQRLLYEEAEKNYAYGIVSFVLIYSLN